MGFKEVTSVKGFWKSVVVLMIAFILFYNFIDLWFSFGVNFAQFSEEKLEGGKLVRFIIANLIGGFVYGFIVVFLQYRGRLKREKEKENY